jgi:hypothetical protein
MDLRANLNPVEKRKIPCPCQNLKGKESEFILMVKNSVVSKIFI